MGGMFLSGWGCVTPGSMSLDAIERDPSLVRTIASPAGNQWSVLQIPVDSVPETASIKRLRRAGRISHYAVAASLRAVKSACARIGQIDPNRFGVVFATSHGSVDYTRRFYAARLADGTGSPALFPDTVYNAPAGHIAAALEITGPAFVEVGDDSAGISALELAGSLIDSGRCDHVCVCGAEETDWVICEAFARFFPVHRGDTDTDQPGMILADGAGAVILSSRESVEGGTAAISGMPVVEKIAVERYLREHDRTRALRRVIVEALGSPEDTNTAKRDQPAGRGVAVIGERWPGDRRERLCLAEYGIVCVATKHILGEGLGASALWQIIRAAELLGSQAAADASQAAADARGQEPGCGFSLGSVGDVLEGPVRYDWALAVCGGLMQQAGVVRLKVIT